MQSTGRLEADRLAGLVEETRVHGSVYTDPAIYETEIDRIFHRGWVFVGHESEVPNAGDFRLKPIGRHPAIMVRGDDGAVRVLLNRCPHRGAQVCVDQQGTARTFTCAYHGWSWRNNGDLAGLPAQEGYGPDFRREDFGLRPVACQGSYRGLIFARLHPEGPSLDEHLGERAKAEIDIAMNLSPVGEITVGAGIHRYGYDANWKLQLENSVDGYHLAFLHRSYFKIAAARGDGARSYRGNFDGPPAPTRTRSLGNGHCVWDFRENNRAQVQRGMPRIPPGWDDGYVAALRAAHGDRYVEDLIDTQAAHILIFPNLIMLASHIRVIRPLAVNQTEVFLYPTTLNGAPASINDQRLRQHESFYGPAGGGATDDLEVFDRIGVGLTADHDPWIDIRRGAHRQAVDADGAISCPYTDELSSRAILHQWRRVMTGREDLLPSHPRGPVPAGKGRIDV